MKNRSNAIPLVLHYYFVFVRLYHLLYLAKRVACEISNDYAYQFRNNTLSYLMICVAQQKRTVGRKTNTQTRFYGGASITIEQLIVDINQEVRQRYSISGN